ncbi:hypothetical protein ACEPAI_2665 [Sanghuangporus weigelae]
MPPSIYRGAPLPAQPELGVTYGVNRRERDESYPSISNRRRRFKMPVLNKVSWETAGQDREGGFICALRRLYKSIDFPEVETLNLSDSEKLDVTWTFGHIPRQLIGLPELGTRTYVRKKDTREIITGELNEQKGTKRIQTLQITYGDHAGLDESKGPRQLCEALKDAMYGLLNMFRMGYMHREIRPNNVVMAISATSDFGYMLSKDGKSVEGEPRFFKGFLYDFTVCKKMNGEEDNQYDGDTETMQVTASSPTSILTIQNRSEYVHSPIYDLDSFLWLLLFAATGTIGDYMSGRRKVRLDDPEYLATRAAKEKKVAEEKQSYDPGPSSCADKQATARCATVNEYRTKIDAANPANSDRVHHIQTDGSADEPTDVDDENSAERAAESEDICGEDMASKRTDVQSDSQNEREGMSEGREDAESHPQEKGAKGKQRATVESDDTETDTDTDSDEDLGIWGPEEAPHPAVWYHKAVGPGFTVSVIKPPEYPPPDDFEPPSKPQYVAFEEDRMAHVIQTLLTPPDIRLFAFYVYKPRRLHLITKLWDFVLGSHGLTPFRPLIHHLVIAGGELYVPEAEIARGREFSRDQIEEVFARYLGIFEKYLPEEENWYYLKEYEGSDILCKFGEDGFLGAFASPTHYKST